MCLNRRNQNYRGHLFNTTLLIACFANINLSAKTSILYFIFFHTPLFYLYRVRLLALLLEYKSIQIVIQAKIDNIQT